MPHRATLLIVAALLIGGCGGGGSSSSYSPPSVTTPTPMGGSVSIVAGARTLTTTAYSPNPLTVSVGTTVTWVNNDTISHTATSNTAGIFDTGTIAPGGQASKQFTSAGSVSYHCTFHSGMVATINVQ